MLYEVITKALKERTPFSLTYRIKTKQGELKWIEEYGIGVYENNALQFIEGVITSYSIHYTKLYEYKTGKTIKANAQKVYDPKNEAYTNNQFYKLPTGEIVAIFDDVTDRILAEQKLIQSEKRFRALAENSTGVI